MRGFVSGDQTHRRLLQGVLVRTQVSSRNVKVLCRFTLPPQRFCEHPSASCGSTFLTVLVLTRFAQALSSRPLGSAGVKRSPRAKGELASAELSESSAQASPVIAAVKRPGDHAPPVRRRAPSR
jgi:hypothetical protein